MALIIRRPALPRFGADDVPMEKPPPAAGGGACALNAKPGVAGGVPLLCRAGDVAIVNRQVVHGSFPNTTDELRASLNFGFHRRASVIGHTGWADTAYDDAHILQRSRVVGVAINARHERFPHETPYVYQPVAAEADALALSDATRQSVLHNYNLLDIGI